MHILYIIHINLKYDEQNRALLDTLLIHRSNNNQGHIVLYTTLLIGHTQHRGHMRVSSWPMVPKKLQQTNRQDWVFIRPPGISQGAFQLRMDNTLACSTASAPMFLCWKSTRARGNKVIFCIFYIFFIF